MTDNVLFNDGQYRNQQLHEWNNLYSSCGQERPKIDDWLDKFLSIINQSADTPIIDLGCGFGNDTLYLSEKGFKVISCDYSQEALKRLVYFIPHPDTRLFNMLDGLPFPDGAAKVILADLSLHYFSSADTDGIIKEISRVLTDGGHLICRLNSVNDVEYGAGIGVEIEENYYSNDGRYKRFFDKKQISHFFTGWNIEYMQECTMNRYLKLKRVWEIALKNVKR